MLDLLVVNNVVFPEPEGGFSVSYEDVTNTYMSESGYKKVEVIREGLVKSVSVSYKGLQETELGRLRRARKTVCSVTYHDAGANGNVTMRMQLTGWTESKVNYRSGISVWGLSFKLEEL